METELEAVWPIALDPSQRFACDENTFVRRNYSDGSHRIRKFDESENNVRDKTKEDWREKSKRPKRNHRRCQFPLNLTKR